MSNAIDWLKKTESDCGNVDTVKHVSADTTEVCVGGVTYLVDRQTGEARSNTLDGTFYIRNVKTNRDKAQQIAVDVIQGPATHSMSNDIADRLLEAGLLVKD